jgi:hypothetical protein
VARPPGRVCAHTPVAVNRVAAFGDFDIVGGIEEEDLGGGEVVVGVREWRRNDGQKLRWTRIMMRIFLGPTFVLTSCI